MSNGIVTEHLISLIAKQVNDNGLVVWCDPDGEYGFFKFEIRIPKLETNSNDQNKRP
jgi:hypothetical protein